MLFLNVSMGAELIYYILWVRPNPAETKKTKKKKHQNHQNFVTNHCALNVIPSIFDHVIVEVQPLAELKPSQPRPKLLR